MAEEVVADSSDSDVELVCPKPRVPRTKRRRILNASEIATVPIYSNKVNSSLKLYPDNPRGFTAMTKLMKEPLEEADSDGLSCTLQVQHSQHSAKPELLEITDSEDEAREQSALENERNRSPSPPPSAITPKRKRGRAYAKIREVDAALNDLALLRSPTSLALLEDDVVLVESSVAQEITLKVRRHSSLYRIVLKTTDTLHTVVNQMASTLNVHPSQILLMLRDEELRPGDTPQSLNLTIVDIIDCIVVSQTTEQQEVCEDTITLRIQGQEKQSHLTVTVRRTEPLKVLMERYKQAKGLQGKKVSFLFEGHKLTARATAEQLGMEPDDVIELWA